MKTYIAILTVVFCLAFVSVCESIVAVNAPQGVTSSVTNKVLTITGIDERVLQTTAGDLRLSRSFKAYVRRNGQVTEEKDLSRVLGVNRKVHLVGEEVTWILFEAQEENQ